jgi:tetratricopeptide (TPR) repeat protein
MKKATTLIIFLSYFITGYSCGNEYGQSMDGKRVYTQYINLSSRYLKHDTVRIQRKLDKANAKISKGTATFKDHSNRALALMKLGELDTATLILVGLAKSHPNEYTIQANLGTVYELQGELDSALKYISIGLQLNPASHRGSEWIHKEILLAKIKRKKHKFWMTHNPILSDSVMSKHNKNKGRFQSVFHHISYQVETRAPFTPAPNEVMGNLLETAGDQSAKTDTYENSILCYAYALKYYPNNYELKDRIQKKITKLNRSRKPAKRRGGLSHSFMRMIKLGELDTDLLVHGLTGVENSLDSIQDINSLAMDVNDRIISENDSLKRQLAETLKSQIEFQEREEASSNSSIYKYGIGVLTIVLLVVVLWNRKRGGRDY